MRIALPLCGSLSFFIARSRAVSLMSNITLFDYEKTELTDKLLAQLPPEHQVFFDFDDSAVNATFTHKSGTCKVQPTDNEFPPTHFWKEFNNTHIVRGALITSSPLASPCYKNWGNYDEQRCSAIVKNWTNPYLQ
jgi:hypothetical protein